MRLITKFSLSYLLITILVLSTGGVISYFIIEAEVDKEMSRQFYDRVQRLEELVERRTESEEEFHLFTKKIPDSANDRRGIIIRSLSYPVKERVEVTDTMIWHDGLQRMERSIKVAAYREIHNRSYYIASYGVLIESDDIAEAVIKTLLWIFGLQLVGAFVMGLYLSNRTLKPFNKLLHQIKDFKLKKRNVITATDTNITEFQDLSRFMEQMTRKAIDDYHNLKEFTENASHELQTPVAIAGSKLELLAESELTSEQLEWVASAQRSIHKLSRLNKALSLLNKIENQEFEDEQEVDFSSLVSESLDGFRELWELSGISVKINISDDVNLKIDPVLADVLWANLFSNAIKHNIENGRILITITNDLLKIENTGKVFEGEPSELFERFKKQNQSSQSIGLGLSIVAQIAERYDWEISYKVREHWHRIDVLFGS